MFRFRGVISAALIAAAGLLPATQGSAAVNYDQTKTYPGKGGVEIVDYGVPRFADSFDFSDLNISNVTSLDLTLAYTGLGTGTCLGMACIGNEAWFVRVQGSEPGASSDDYFQRLVRNVPSFTVTITSATDSGSVDAFIASITNQVLTFWFSEQTTGNDAFHLASARLVINGDLAPVPLPAAAPMLAVGLGGLALLRRRRKRA